MCDDHFNNWINMKVTIVGGSGFIGTRLCKRLISSDLYSIGIVDKVESIFYPNITTLSDVRYFDELSRSIPEHSLIINLAAEHRDNVSPKTLYDQVNVFGAKNVCSIARAKNIGTIIFTSSVAVYGFAPLGTNESGGIKPFNDYGRTKWEAEKIYKVWQAEDPENRTLVIIRPTVVFGERNRGNVFNLLKQIASGQFVMVGDGQNRKSMAYVENVAAFIEFSLNFKPGVHIYNYIDKPDFTMNSLVGRVNKILRQSEKIKLRLPYFIGLTIGKFFDFIAFVTRRKLAISSIRVKKFCANSVYESAISKTGFIPPVPLLDAIERTVRYEFIEDHKEEPVYFSE
jgi:nucleoside-diphosphate-sugar epimerase